MRVKVTAPGRVNLIGEHTDYNDGFVLPTAIDLNLTVEAVSLPGRRINAKAGGVNEAASFSLDQLQPPGGVPGWVDYIKGICLVLQEAGYSLGGAELTIESSIPMGAGLSSSAALELAVGAALAALSGYDIPLRELAMLSQRAENVFVGVNCGIMDQFAVALGRKEHALLLDCRSLNVSHIPLQLGSYCILIINSRVERTLSSSGYNQRRRECEEAVEKLAGLYGRPLQALRDVSLEEVRAARSELGPVLFSRSLYVVEENMRVQESASVLQSANLSSFGSLMALSHAGLRDLYQVSCPELDLIVETTEAVEGVAGARMTGAGFGGCAVALLEQEAVAETTARIKGAFAERGWQEPHFYLTTAARGVTVEG